jgi:hypothetical protein
MVKALEERQETWVNTLIKPQEVNQARLFSVDTRIKEGELTRLRDLQFMRDTFKKLIYAIEQQKIAFPAAGPGNTDQRPSSYGGRRMTAGTTRPGFSVADQNFGAIGQSMLPQVNDVNTSL